MRYNKYEFPEQFYKTYKEQNQRGGHFQTLKIKKCTRILTIIRKHSVISPKVVLKNTTHTNDQFYSNGKNLQHNVSLAENSLQNVLKCIVENLALTNILKKIYIYTG